MSKTINVIVDKHVVVAVKDAKGKIKSFEKGILLRSKLKVSEEEFDSFNKLSNSTLQRYFKSTK